MMTVGGGRNCANAEDVAENHIPELADSRRWVVRFAPFDSAQETPSIPFRKRTGQLSGIEVWTLLKHFHFGFMAFT
ncbi:hypothetical protein [Methylomagnum sp.]